MSSFDLGKVVSSLKNGELIVYPTDTLYALGADIFNKSAVKNIFLIKKRSLNQPLSIAVSNIDALKDVAFVDDRIIRIAERFLPGKLTLILKKKKAISDILTAGSDRIAVRIPNNNIALQILSAFGPLTCTSANIHGFPTPYKINDIRIQFKDKINIYLDAGELKSKPSTIVDISNEKVMILREGSIPSKKVLRRMF